MNNEAIAVLNVRRLPGRLDSNQAASVLGFAAHDLSELVRRRLLKPVGRPEKNAVKYFAAADIEALAKDPVWISDATNAIYKHWKEKNRRKTRPAVSLTNLSEHEQAA